jgi:hypothetical protein
MRVKWMTWMNAQIHVIRGIRATSSLSRILSFIKHKTPMDVAPKVHTPSEEVVAMLWTLFVILLIMWLLGMVSSYTMGGFIHILLVLALVAVVIQLISGRRAL